MLNKMYLSKTYKGEDGQKKLNLDILYNTSISFSV